MNETKKGSKFYVAPDAADSVQAPFAGKASRIDAPMDEEALRAEKEKHRMRGLKPFTKDDPRINREGGRISTLVQLRALIQEIGGEVINVQVGKGDKARVLAMTRFQKLVLEMFASRDPSMRKLLLEYAFGKVPHTVDLQSGGKAISWLEFIGRDVLEGELEDADPQLPEPEE